MTGGSAAAQIIIIHRRQVIVHERVHVHELDGTGHRFDLLFRESEVRAVANTSAGRIRLPPPSTL